MVVKDIWNFFILVEEVFGGYPMRSNTCSMLIRDQKPALQQCAGNPVLSGWTHYVLRAQGGHSTGNGRMEMVGFSPGNKHIRFLTSSHTHILRMKTE